MVQLSFTRDPRDRMRVVDIMEHEEGVARPTTPISPRGRDDADPGHGPEVRTRCLRDPAVPRAARSTDRPPAFAGLAAAAGYWTRAQSCAPGARLRGAVRRQCRSRSCARGMRRMATGFSPPGSVWGFAIAAPTPRSRTDHRRRFIIAPGSARASEDTTSRPESRRPARFHGVGDHLVEEFTPVTKGRH